MVQFNKRPFEALEGSSCNLTVLWLIGKNQPVNITTLIQFRYAGPGAIYNAVDDLIKAKLVTRSDGLQSSKPLSLSEAGNILYTSCILKALEILQNE